MVEQMKLNNETMHTLLDAIKSDITVINKELSEIDVNDLTLNDLTYKSKIKKTLTYSECLSIYLEMLDLLKRNYAYAESQIESNAQIKERLGSDNEMSLTVANFTESEIAKKIDIINAVIDSDSFKALNDAKNDKLDYETLDDETKAFHNRIIRLNAEDKAIEQTNDDIINATVEQADDESDDITNDEKEQLSMEYHLKRLKDFIAPHILKDLNQYSIEQKDDTDRVILRTSEILVNAMKRQYNIYIANLIKDFGYSKENYYDDGAGNFSVIEFNKDWLIKRLPFNDITDE